MREITQRGPGTFCWPELATSDQAAAKAFYAALFGWTVEEHPVGGAGVYMIFKHNNRDVAAASGMQEQQRAQGVPPHWLSYISVASADDAASKAKRLGGKEMMEPFDVMELGRMAILQDPTGATFALWQAKGHVGIRAADEPGTLVWTELLTSNAEMARDFYSKLFGWGVRERPTKWSSQPYTTFMRGDQQAGGMIQITPEMGSTPSQWLPYFGTPDSDATSARALQLGGNTIVPPSDVPEIARFAIFQDPPGAMFGILSSLR
jgi:predicted enzyme related to lactoylglutathione lyase